MKKWIVLLILIIPTLSLADAVRLGGIPSRAQMGVDNVDNTSDANKPVSTAQAIAINAKADKAQGFNNWSAAYLTKIRFANRSTAVSAQLVGKQPSLGLFPPGTVLAGPVSGGAAAPTAKTLAEVGIATAAQGAKVDLIKTVIDYGAKGDARVLFDGVVSASSTTFTSATAGFTPTDTGKVIIIHGAGANDLILQTTITYVNSTTVTLATAASTTVSGKEFAYGTDDTAAIQAAVNSLTNYTSPESNPRIYGAHLVTALIFPPGKAFMTSGTITVSNKSDAYLTGMGSVFMGDYTLFNFRGCHNVFAWGMSIEGMQYNHMITAPTTSTAFHFGVGPSGEWSTHNGVQWCSVKRVKRAVLADGPGYEMLVDWNQFQTYNVLNSSGAEIGMSDNSHTNNIINGFQTGSTVTGVVTMVAHNHWWDNNAKMTTGNLASGSPTITGIADTSVWIVGDYVTVSAGMPSATAFYKILSKVTNTSITLDTAAISPQIGATVSTAGILYNLVLGPSSGGATVSNNEFDNCVKANVKVVPDASNPWYSNYTFSGNFYQRSKWSQPFISFEPTVSTGLNNISIKGEKFFASANTGVGAIAYNGNVNHSADSNYLLEDNQYYGVSPDTYENKRLSLKADLAGGIVPRAQLGTGTSGYLNYDGTFSTPAGTTVSDSVSATSSTVAASSTAVKAAYDLAASKQAAGSYLTTISDSTSTTSSTTAASSTAVKAAYDLANGKGVGTVTGVTAGAGLSGGTVSTSGTLTNDLSTGKAGGQTAIGGTGSGDNLNISSTSHATKGYTNFDNLMHLEGSTGQLALTGNPSIAASFGTVPAAKLHLIGENTTGQDNAGIFQDMFSTASAFGSLNFRRARGSYTSPSKVLISDRLGGIGVRGYYGVAGSGGGFPAGGTATIFFDAAEDANDSTHLGTIISFNTTPKTSGTRAEAMRINGSGNVSIGNINDTYKLDVTGTANVTAGVITTNDTYAESVQTLGSTSAALYIDSSAYAHYDLTTYAGGTPTHTISFTNLPASGKVRYVGVKFTTAASGSATLAWPAVGSTFGWMGPTAGQSTALTASKTYEYVCRVESVKTWCGIVAEGY